MYKLHECNRFYHTTKSLFLEALLCDHCISPLLRVNGCQMKA